MSPNLSPSDRQAMLQEIADWEVSAERDDIARYFYHFDDVSAVEKGSVFGIIGHKGEGKTAIAEWLHDINREGRTGQSVKLTLRDYPLADIYSLEDVNLSHPYQYSTIWSYIIAASVMKMAARDSEFDRQQLHYLTKKYPTEFKDNSDSLKSIINRGVQVKVWGFEASVGASKDVSIPERLFYYRDIFDNAVDDFIRIKTSKPYYIIFDELDEYYNNIATDKHERQRYFDLIAGLIRSIDAINRQLSKTECQIYPIFCIRADIYQRIYFNDKNKLKSQIRDISWNTRKIKNLLSHRISKSHYPNTLNNVVWDFSTAWEMLFDKDDFDRRKFKFDWIFNFIERRTFLRPRDFVNFLSVLARLCLDRGGASINHRDLLDSESLHADYLRGEVDDACGGLDPTFLDIVNCIGELEGAEFSAQQLIEIIRQRADADFLRTMKPEKMVEELYNHNVIGPLRNKHPVFAYMHLNNGYFAPSGDFQVHRGLWKYFQLADNTRKS